MSRFCILSAKFQFHKGTIKTARGKMEQGRAADFNSIKVRLKRATSTASCHIVIFQFHKGTIKTQNY